MPTASPSPSQKRPSMAERSSSAHSLSSSGKRDTVPKTHRVNRHSRNVSHGKGLSKLGRISSTTNVTADGRNHVRKKSGPATPGHSPKAPVSPHMKRNSSHAALTKNVSHGNLRKNHSAKELSANRNLSQGNLKKLGAPPSQKPKDEQKQGVFALADESSEEEEGEWEDSNTVSPELSRNQSKTNTPLRSRTPNTESPQRSHLQVTTAAYNPTSITENTGKANETLRSALEQRGLEPIADHKPADPALLQQSVRAARAPPAMSTISAEVKRTDSVRSFASLNKKLASSSGKQSLPGAGTSSSTSGGVSHFLTSTPTMSTPKLSQDDSDDETSAFMANYKPQPTEHPERPRTLNKARLPSVPSRTQQRLELQRREIMRAGGGGTSNPSATAISLGAGSAVSLHNRSGSQGRMRSSMSSDPKTMRLAYEATVKQFAVVRRFRNPVLDSVHRLQGSKIIPSDASSSSTAAQSNTIASRSRPQSRRGVTSGTTTPKVLVSRSPEDKKSNLDSSKNAAGGGNGVVAQHPRASKVQFQLSRQGSHDDIGLTTSQGSPEEYGDENDGMSPEEALIRRIWESNYTRE